MKIEINVLNLISAVFEIRIQEVFEFRQGTKSAVPICLTSVGKSIFLPCMSL